VLVQQLGLASALSVAYPISTVSVTRPSVVWGGLPPFRRGCQGLSVVVSHDGLLSSSWTEWKRPSMGPDGSFTVSEKGLACCTVISSRSVSRLGLWPSWILVCALLSTPSPEVWLLFTLQRKVAREWSGVVQLRTTCTPPNRGRPWTSRGGEDGAPYGVCIVSLAVGWEVLGWCRLGPAAEGKTARRTASVSSPSQWAEESLVGDGCRSAAEGETAHRTASASSPSQALRSAAHRICLGVAQRTQVASGGICLLAVLVAAPRGGWVVPSVAAVTRSSLGNSPAAHKRRECLRAVVV